jgi:nitric oxide reductase subunit C
MMTNRTAKTIFYVGTLSSAILFLALTLDTHRQVKALTNADQLSDEVVAGKHVFQKYNCNDCHTILGFGGYYSPDLTRVYSRRGEGYIRTVITRPDSVFAKSFRRMPQQHVSPWEIERLVAFFRWVDNIDNHDWPPQDSKKRLSTGARRLMEGATLSPGAALFKENGCFDCHKLAGAGGDSGPALDDIGLRLELEKIVEIIRDPQSVNPNATMPAFDLSQSDVQAIAEFLVKQRGER